MPWPKAAEPQLKISPTGVNRMTIGHEITKNSSSRKRVVIISVVARPSSMPSRLRNIMPSDEPPTAEGVMHDVNSQRKSTLNACIQRSLWPVRARNRQLSPTSRPIMNTQAMSRKRTVWAVTRMEWRTCPRSSLRASCTNISATTPRPMSTGSMTFQAEKVFFSAFCGS